MKTLLAVVLTASCLSQAVLGSYDDMTKRRKCICECEDWQQIGPCECECKDPKTECAPGYTKVCPEEDGKCKGDTPEPLCPKDIFGLLGPAERALDGWVHVKEVEERAEVATPVRNPRKRSRIEDQAVRCPGIPKFRCDFIIDYAPASVTSFKAVKCTHRKNIERCKVKVETKDGCTVTAFLYNKQATIIARGKITIECPYTTTAAPTTTPGETPVAMLPPVATVGDGCTCVPDFAMSMLSSGVETRQAASEEPQRETRVQGKVTQEVQCKGIPKFECDFVYDYEACSRINTLNAIKCTHRKDVKKCPIKLVTRDGCEINTIITNKGAKMLTSPTKSKIAWGADELTGFM